MEKIFEIGEVVQLKSGGPKMTIEYIPDDYNIKCVWFVKATLVRGEFKKTLLQRVSV